MTKSCKREIRFDAVQNDIFNNYAVVLFPKVLNVLMIILYSDVIE